MPPVRILDNMQLEPNDYKVRIKEVEAGHGQIFANQLMVMDPMGREISLPGHHTTEPTFGLPATWIEPALRDEAELRGLLDHRSLDGDLDPPDRSAQGQCRRPAELCQRAVAARRPLQGPAEAGRGHRARP